MTICQHWIYVVRFKASSDADSPITRRIELWYPSNLELPTIGKWLPIGSWDRVLKSEYMTLEVVEGLVACVEELAMRRGR
jgi:hypothetical protein